MAVWVRFVDELQLGASRDRPSHYGAEDAPGRQRRAGQGPTANRTKECFACGGPEVARPTFAARPKPLHSLCRFLPYSRLCERLEEARNVIRYLRPEFLDEIAELYEPEAEVEAS